MGFYSLISKLFCCKRQSYSTHAYILPLFSFVWFLETNTANTSPQKQEVIPCQINELNQLIKGSDEPQSSRRELLSSCCWGKTQTRQRHRGLVLSFLSGGDASVQGGESFRDVFLLHRVKFHLHFSSFN